MVLLHKGRDEDAVGDTGLHMDTKAVEKAQMRARSDKPSVHENGPAPFSGSRPSNSRRCKAGGQAPILTSICFGFASSAFGTVTVSTPSR